MQENNANTGIPLVRNVKKHIEETAETLRRQAEAREAEQKTAVSLFSQAQTPVSPLAGWDQFSAGTSVTDGGQGGETGVLDLTDPENYFARIMRRIAAQEAQEASMQAGMDPGAARGGREERNGKGKDRPTVLKGKDQGPNGREGKEDKGGLENEGKDIKDMPSNEQAEKPDASVRPEQKKDANSRRMEKATTTRLDPRKRAENAINAGKEDIGQRLEEKIVKAAVLNDIADRLAAESTVPHPPVSEGPGEKPDDRGAEKPRAQEERPRTDEKRNPPEGNRSTTPSEQPLGKGEPDGTVQTVETEKGSMAKNQGPEFSDGRSVQASPWQAGPYAAQPAPDQADGRAAAGYTMPAGNIRSEQVHERMVSMTAAVLGAEQAVSQTVAEQVKAQGNMPTQQKAENAANAPSQNQVPSAGRQAPLPARITKPLPAHKQEPEAVERRIVSRDDLEKAITGFGREVSREDLEKMMGDLFGTSGRSGKEKENIPAAQKEKPAPGKNDPVRAHGQDRAGNTNAAAQRPVPSSGTPETVKPKTPEPARDASAAGRDTSLVRSTPEQKEPDTAETRAAEFGKDLNRHLEYGREMAAAKSAVREMAVFTQKYGRPVAMVSGDQKLRFTREKDGTFASINGKKVDVSEAARFVAKLGKENPAMAPANIMKMMSIAKMDPFQRGDRAPGKDMGTAGKETRTKVRDAAKTMTH